MITIEADVKNFNQAILRYQKAYRVNMEKVLKYQMLRLMEKVLQLMPPRTRATGTNTVKGDIGKVWQPYTVISRLFAWDEGNQYSFGGVGERLKKYLRNNQIGKFNEVSNDIAFLKYYDAKQFSPSDGVRNESGHYVKRDRKILVTNPAKLKEFIKNKTSRVGTLKGSIAESLERMGGTVPQWIKKNARYLLTDQSSDKMKPGIIYESLVDYSGDVDRRHNVTARALRYRTKDILKSIDVGVLNKSLTEYYKK